MIILKRIMHCAGLIICLALAALAANPNEGVEISARQRTLSAIAESYLPAPKETRKEIIDRVTRTADAGISLAFEQWSTPMRVTERAIFSCALSASYMPKDARQFVGTARKAGFAGDIVVGVIPGASQLFLDALKKYNASVYTVSTKCSGKMDIRCTVPGFTDLPVTLLRLKLYQIWATKYPSSAYIMNSDFRDVIFQANPFKYKFSSWGPDAYELVLSQEPHPNRVINRCPRIGGYVLNCYGKQVYHQLGSATVSNNGVVLGTRDATIVYNHLILEQLDPATRHTGINATGSADKHCYSFGMDQAFHNYLLYTHRIAQLLNIKVFDQGEGPVNTLGGFYGEKKILRALLSEWKILRGEAPYRYVHNWNGELSPVVHQLDRYLTSELKGGYSAHLAVFQHLI